MQTLQYDTEATVGNDSAVVSSSSELFSDLLQEQILPIRQKPVPPFRNTSIQTCQSSVYRRFETRIGRAPSKQGQADCYNKKNETCRVLQRNEQKR